MSLTHGINRTTDSLVVSLDAANVKSNRGRRSLINWESWTVSTGPVIGYPVNGTAAESQRIADTDPFGDSNIVWGSYPLGNNNACGGWDGTYFNIDNTKTYRFTVWVRRTSAAATGTFYFGLQTNGTGSTIHLSTGLTEGNPYWSYPSATSLTQNLWYLYVGHIYPFNYTGTTAHPDSGYYTIASGKIGANNGNVPNDVRFPVNSTQAYSRVYHYYATDTTSRLQFYQPRVDLVDGTEPTILELLSNAGSKVKDLTGSGYDGIMYSSVTYNSVSPASFGFNGLAGSGSNITVTPYSISSSDYTIEAWAYWTRPTAASEAIVAFQNGGYANGLFTQYGATGAQGNKIWFCAGYLGLGGSLDLQYVVEGTTAFPTNTWTHVVGVRSGVNLSLYVNGVLNATKVAPGVINQTTSYMHIGHMRASQHEFLGNIAKVNLYIKALTATEVLQNYTATRGQFGV
jgi:hypothetical protein